MNLLLVTSLIVVFLASKYHFNVSESSVIASKRLSGHSETTFRENNITYSLQIELFPLEKIILCTKQLYYAVRQQLAAFSSSTKV